MKKPELKGLSVKLELQQYEALCKLATQKGHAPLAALIRQAIDEYLEHESTEPTFS